MEVYILKSIACLGVLFLFYKLALENTALHTTKRVYLLGSLVISIIIPFITFTQYVAVAPVSQMVSENFVVPVLETQETIADPINYTLYILWTIYGLGVLFFTLRFAKNLYSLVQKIRKNPIYKEQSILYVLLQLQVTPHSFFNYIFFDKEAFEAGDIPKEVIIHEQAHVNQKHSWDILFFEIFQIVFWFNPLLYFFKRSIKLNHEFLADRTVLQTGAPLATYQSILLDFSSKSSVPAMAHSINYSSIKKRFTIMKTHTSKRAALLKGLLVLPLLAVLVYGFSSTEVIEKPNNLPTDNNQLIVENKNNKRKEHLTARSISIKIINENDIIVQGTKALKKDLYQTLGSINTDITKEQRDRIINIHVSADGDISYKDLLYIQKVATVYGYHRIVTPKEEIIRSKGNVPMAPESPIVPHNNYANEYVMGANEIGLKPFLLQIELSKIRLNGVPVKLENFANAVDKYTKDWEETDYTETRPNVLLASTPKSFLDKVDAEFKKTHFSKANGGMGIIPPPPPTTKKVTMVVESVIPPPPPPVPPTSKMVLKGEKSNIPPPPPPPISMGDVTKKYEYSYVLYVNGESIYLNGKVVSLSKFAKAMDNHTKNWPDSAYKFYGVSTKKENVTDAFIDKINREYRKTNLAKKSSSKNPTIFSKSDSQLPPPPPPPPGPEQPLDHVIAMSKRGASFYLEKESITSDKAIELIKKNPELNIQTRLQDPKPPMVYMSKKGITIKSTSPKNETVASVKAMKTDTAKSGPVIINNKTYYYIKEGDDIKYYNRWGKLVNEKGEEINP